MIKNLIHSILLRGSKNIRQSAAGSKKKQPVHQYCSTDSKSLDVFAPQKSITSSNNIISTEIMAEETGLSFDDRRNHTIDSQTEISKSEPSFTQTPCRSVYDFVTDAYRRIIKTSKNQTTLLNTSIASDQEIAKDYYSQTHGMLSRDFIKRGTLFNSPPQSDVLTVMSSKMHSIMDSKDPIQSATFMFNSSPQSQVSINGGMTSRLNSLMDSQQGTVSRDLIQPQEASTSMISRKRPLTDYSQQGMVSRDLIQQHMYRSPSQSKASTGMSLNQYNLRNMKKHSRCHQSLT